ncbi:MAG TPA: hypothetical protein DCY93_00915, partial [Firmicutes bacterium]|nr:hypothetical protein [Bacillota bacterium]
MKNKEEESLKDLFRGEEIPEYNAQEAFENFERKFPLNDSYNEVYYKPKKKNRFKWLYWVPAVATALVVIPISCLITNAITNSNHKTRDNDAYIYVQAKYKITASAESCYLTINDLRQKIYTFYCEDDKGAPFFAAYAKTKLNLKIKALEENYSFSSSNILFEKKLENLDTFNYY